MGRYFRSPLGIAGAVLWFSAVYVPCALVVAARKHLWNDELFTFYIARVGSFEKIYAALLTAADQNPPPFYWLTSLGMNLNASAAGIRLPAIFGVWLMGVCLIYWFSRYGMAAYGLVAALFAIVTGAHAYATEGRPYGLVLGLAAAAILCWQRTLTQRNISLWAIGLAVSLGGAVSVHYYAVLVFPPIILAELAVALKNRKIQWPVWCGLVAGMLPLVLWLPLIQAARSYSGTYWAKADASSIADFYSFALLPALLPLLAFATAVSVRCLGSPDQSLAGLIPDIPELICVMSLCLMPVLAIALGRFVTGAYTHRYVIFAVLGFAIILAWLLMRLFGPQTTPAIVAAGVLTSFFIVREVSSFRWVGNVANHAVDAQFLMKHVPRGDIAIADPHLFFELTHQSPPALRARLFYIADRAAALHHLGTDVVDRGVIDMKAFAGLRVRSLDEVLNSGQRFAVYGYPAYWAWLVADFADRRVPMSIHGSFNKRLLVFTSTSDSGGRN